MSADDTPPRVDAVEGSGLYTETVEHQMMVLMVGSGRATAKAAIARLVSHGHHLTDRAALDYTTAELRHRNRQYGQASETIGILRHRVVKLETDRRGWIRHSLAAGAAPSALAEQCEHEAQAAGLRLTVAAQVRQLGVLETVRLSSDHLIEDLRRQVAQAEARCEAATATVVDADVARMRDALLLIAGDRCETYTSGRCWSSGRVRVSTTGTADQWCDACRAADALAPVAAALSGEAQTP